MKTLKENTIDPRGIGFGEFKTIFNVTDDKEKSRSNYIKMTNFIGRNMYFHFKFDEDGQEKLDKIRVIVPNGNEEEIKIFLISQINDQLNK